jgi:hypothetical protein
MNYVRSLKVCAWFGFEKWMASHFLEPESFAFLSATTRTVATPTTGFVESGALVNASGVSHTSRCKAAQEQLTIQKARLLRTLLLCKRVIATGDTQCTLCNHGYSRWAGGVKEKRGCFDIVQPDSKPRHVSNEMSVLSDYLHLPLHRG